MKQSGNPEADSQVHKEIHRILWNQNVYYRVCKSRPLDAILTQLHSVHVFTQYYFKIRFNIILPSTHAPISHSFRFTEQLFF
jgi:hypothetical protein